MLKYDAICLLFSLALLISAADESDNNNKHESVDKKSPSEKLLQEEVRQLKMEIKHQTNMAVRELVDHGVEDDWEGGIVSDDNPEQDWIEFDAESIKEARQRSGRVKRQWIIPGTNWCGVGNVSKDNQSTGDMAGVDACCREHDHCPYTIAGFRTKYNLYNFRFHTISHCECDDIFRTCLKMSSHQQAHVVGDLFFNMIGMKCFVFRRDQVCAERSWWGRCERQKYEWSAETRDPIQY